MEKFFKLKANGTTVRIEVIAGITTFLTMAYIIALNPNLLTGFDTGSKLWNAVFLATCLASALGTFVMAFYANKPFAMAPGMGINTFFAIIVANIVTLTGSSYVQSFQAALCIILIEGVIFLLLSVFNIREKIAQAIPRSIRFGISPAIGLMLINIGLGSNAGVYDADGNVYYVMKDFFGALTPKILMKSMGGSYPMMVITVLTMFIGLFAIIIMAHKRITGSVLWGMLIASGFYWLMEALVVGVNPFASLANANFIPPFGDMISTTFFKFDFVTLSKIGWLSMIAIIITYCIIDMFDTIGALIGTASRAKMVDKDGNVENMKEALTSDAVGTIAGAVCGTSTVTTYIESAAGIESGGRTGLTAVTTGIMFLLSMFLAPIVAVIPAAATSAALIYVGILMFAPIKNLNLHDLTQVAPVVIMLIAMPISGSIGHGIGLGIISYTVLCIFTGRRKEVSLFTFIIAALFLLKFFLPI